VGGGTRGHRVGHVGQLFELPHSRRRGTREPRILRQATDCRTRRAEDRIPSGELGTRRLWRDGEVTLRDSSLVFGGAEVLADVENVFSLVADLTPVSPTVELGAVV